MTVQPVSHPIWQSFNGSAEKNVIRQIQLCKARGTLQNLEPVIAATGASTKHWVRDQWPDSEVNDNGQFWGSFKLLFQM